jgi:protein-disulfide isomerase
MHPLDRIVTCITLAALALGCGSSEAARNGARASSDSTAKGASDAGPASDPLLVAVDQARIQGSESAPLWVVEISDFQCPYCKQWHDVTYPVLKREFIATGKIRFAYVNLPLQSHQHAWPAAEAAMCGGAQGKFWEMHDRIFDTQQQWQSLASSAAVFDSLAASVQLDMPRFRECVASRLTRPMVQADYDRSVQEAGVNSTPTFIIGRVLAQGAQPIDTFRRIIEQQLSGAQAPRP